MTASNHSRIEEQKATGVPVAREALEQGRRAQQMGVPDRALDHFRDAAEVAGSPVEAAEAWRRIASVLRSQCRWDEALEAAHRSASFARQAGDDDAMAEALNAQAAVHIVRCEFGVARPLLEEVARIACTDRTRGIARQNLALVAARSGDFDAADAHLDAAAALYREAGYAWGEACVLVSLAGVALDRGDFVLADERGDRARAAAREVDDLNLLAVSTKNHAEALAKLDRLPEAEELASESLGYFHLTGDALMQLECYKLLAEIAVCARDVPTARSCYRKGLELARRASVPVEIAALERRLEELADDAGDEPPA